MTGFTMKTLGAKLEWEGFEYIFELNPETIPEEIRGSFILAQKHYNILLAALQPYMNGEFDDDIS